jgi:hypothetical protein
MEELKNLLKKIEGKIRPESAEILVMLYPKMEEEKQKEVIDAIKQLMTQSDLIMEFGRRRNGIYERGMQKLKEVGIGYENRYKTILAEGEKKEETESSKKAEEALTQI